MVVSLPVKPALATIKAPKLDLGWSTGVQSPARSVRVKTAHQANPQGRDMNGSCVRAPSGSGASFPRQNPSPSPQGNPNDAGPLRLQCRSAPNIDQKQLARDRHTTVLFNPGLTSHLLPLNPINPPKYPHPPDHNPPRNPHRPPHPLPLLPLTRAALAFFPRTAAPPLRLPTLQARDLPRHRHRLPSRVPPRLIGAVHIASPRDAIVGEEDAGALRADAALVEGCLGWGCRGGGVWRRPRL